MYQSSPFTRARTTNASGSAFTAKAFTATKPSGDGVHTVGIDGGGAGSPRAVHLIAFGAGSDNDAFDMKLIGWRRIVAAGVSYWQPVTLGKLRWTLSALVGVAGGPLLNTDRIADTVAVGIEWTATADVTREGLIELFVGVADLEAAAAEIELRGCELIEFDYDQITGTPTMNNLWAPVD